MINPADLDGFMLALCVWREARGEPLEGKILVAETIINRSVDGRWPRTIRGVILQQKQFSAFSSGDVNATLFPALDTSWEECCEAANFAMSNASQTGVNHYHALSVAPAWSYRMKQVRTVGNHVFYTD